jgi:transcription initiation factor TFIIB
MIESSNIILQNRCPECNGVVINQRERLICQKCGLIINDTPLVNYERATYSKEEREKKERVGGRIPYFYPDLSLLTHIPDDKDDSDFNRSTKWNRYKKWKIQRKIIGYFEMKRLISQLEVLRERKENVVISEALKLYYRIADSSLLRGRSCVGFSTACLYIVIRQKELPILSSEIVEFSKIPENRFRKNYITICRYCNLKIPPINLVNYLIRYASNFNFQNKHIQKMIKCLKILKKTNISGKNPLGYIAGLIYLFSRVYGYKLIQRQIAQKLGITQVTLRARYKEIQKAINLSQV